MGYAWRAWKVRRAISLNSGMPAPWLWQRSASTTRVKERSAPFANIFDHVISDTKGHWVRSAANLNR
jgi:hypothetical protein